MCGPNVTLCNSSQNAATCRTSIWSSSNDTCSSFVSRVNLQTSPAARKQPPPSPLPGLQAGSFICVHISLEPAWISRLSVSGSRRTWLLTLKSPGKIGFSGRTDMGPGPTSFWLISSATALATVLISLLLSVCLTTYLWSRQRDSQQQLFLLCPASCEGCVLEV